MEQLIPNKPFFRVDEVTDLLQVHENTVRNWIKQDRLSIARLPTHRIRIPRTAMLQLLSTPKRRVISRGVEQ